MSKGWKKRSAELMEAGGTSAPTGGSKVSRGRGMASPPPVQSSLVDEIEDSPPRPSSPLRPSASSSSSRQASSSSSSSSGRSGTLAAPTSAASFSIPSPGVRRSVPPSVRSLPAAVDLAREDPIEQYEDSPPREVRSLQRRTSSQRGAAPRPSNSRYGSLLSAPPSSSSSSSSSRNRGGSVRHTPSRGPSMDEFDPITQYDDSPPPTRSLPRMTASLREAPGLRPSGARHGSLPSAPPSSSSRHRIGPVQHGPPRGLSMDEFDPIEDPDGPFGRDRSASPPRRRSPPRPSPARASQASSSSSSSSSSSAHGLSAVPLAPPVPGSALAAPSTSFASRGLPSWEDLNKSKGAAEHRFAMPWSWWTAQPRFAHASSYKENEEHPTDGDVAKRDRPERAARRTRDPARFSIKALSELDARPVGKSGTPREQLEFLQRRRGFGGAAVFSRNLVVPKHTGGSARGVALEPLYVGGQYQGHEQQSIDKGKSHFRGDGRTYPDWVARSPQGGGSYKTIAFDLKVPLARPGYYMEMFYQPRSGKPGIKQEFEQRRERMAPGTEQRLVFDLVSGGHDYSASKRSIVEFARSHPDESGRFVADSAQFLYRKEIKDKSGPIPRGTGRYEVKMSKPIALNPPSALSVPGASSSSAPPPPLPGMGGPSSSIRHASSSSMGSTGFPSMPPPPGPLHPPGPPAVRTGFGLSPRPPGSSFSSSSPPGSRPVLAPALRQPPPPSSSSSTSSSSLRSSSSAAIPRGGQPGAI